MVTDEQVRLLRRKRMDGKSQEAAAAAAGMSVRTARAWDRGPLPSQTKKKRSWRTREDAFDGVWALEIEPLLRRDEERVLQATTLLDLLEQRHPGEFGVGQLRTLQRRIRVFASSCRVGWRLSGREATYQSPRSSRTKTGSLSKAGSASSNSAVTMVARLSGNHTRRVR